MSGQQHYLDDTHKHSIDIIKTRHNAICPSVASRGSAGLDLYAARGCIIKPNDCRPIATGIHIERMPKGCYGRIADRSSNAFVRKLHVIGGVIDNDYQGEIFVILQNFGENYAMIHESMNIGQLIFEKYVKVRKIMITPQASAKDDHDELEKASQMGTRRTRKYVTRNN